MGGFDPEKKSGADDEVEIPVHVDVEKGKSSGVQFG